MYINRTNNHIIKIKDEDLFLLLDRYNLENFEVLETLNGEKVYKNSSKCPFCEKYYKRNDLKKAIFSEKFVSPL